MRISDWSSDVCSSDLFAGAHFVYAPECLALFRQTEPAGRISKQVNVAPSQYWLDRGGAELLSNEARNLFMATVIMPRLYPSRPLYSLAWMTKALIRGDLPRGRFAHRSEEHTSELQSLMRIS